MTSDLKRHAWVIAVSNSGRVVQRQTHLGGIAIRIFVFLLNSGFRHLVLVIFGCPQFASHHVRHLSIARLLGSPQRGWSLFWGLSSGLGKFVSPVYEKGLVRERPTCGCCRKYHATSLFPQDEGEDCEEKVGGIVFYAMVLISGEPLTGSLYGVPFGTH